MATPRGSHGNHGGEEDEDSPVRVFAPHLSRALRHGTAKHVEAEGAEDQPCLSIVAQAERKTDYPS